MVSHTGEMPYKVSSACLRRPYKRLLDAGTKEEGASLSVLGQPGTARQGSRAHRLPSPVCGSLLRVVPHLGAGTGSREAPRPGAFCGITRDSCSASERRSPACCAGAPPVLSWRQNRCLGGSWKLTLLSRLSVLLLRPAVHAEEGPAEPHDKAARRAKAPRGKGSGWELSCAQAWPKPEPAPIVLPGSV